MKIFMVFLFFAALTVAIVDSQARGHPSPSRGNSNSGKNSRKPGGNFHPNRGSLSKPRNPPRHIGFKNPTHNKPIAPNRPAPNRPITPNKPKITIKSTPNKPITSNKPIIPNKSISPNKPTTPNKPIAPNKPTSNKPVTPNKPITPITSNKPVTPNKPNTSITFNKPVTPNKPNTPITSNKPVTPNKPNTPITSNKPVTPNKPITSITSNKPVTPNKPNTPITSNKPVTPNKPITPITSNKDSKNGHDVTLTAGASLQKGNKPGAFIGIQSTKGADNIDAQVKVVDGKYEFTMEGTKQVYNKNGIDISVKGDASLQKGSQLTGTKPDVTLGLKGTKNGDSLNAEVKTVNGVRGWGVRGTTKIFNKSGNEVTLTGGASQQKGSKPDLLVGIEGSKGNDKIGAQVNVVNQIPELILKGTKQVYNKNGIDMSVNAGTTLQKGSKPEQYIGIKATKDGDSLNANLNKADGKLGWDVIGKKKIYDKNGVEISINAGAQQKPGGKTEGTAGVEVNIPI